MKSLQQTLRHKRRTRHGRSPTEARCTCQCWSALAFCLPAQTPNGWQVPLCCCGMPHGCDWPAPRRVSSARRSDRVASATRLDSTLSQELPHALARVMAHAARLNARLSPRVNASVLAADSPPPAKEAQRRMRHRRRMAGWS